MTRSGKMAAYNRLHGMEEVMEMLTTGRPPEIASMLEAKRGVPEDVFDHFGDEVVVSFLVRLLLGRRQRDLRE